MKGITLKLIKSYTLSSIIKIVNDSRRKRCRSAKKGSIQRKRPVQSSRHLADRKHLSSFSEGGNGINRDDTAFLCKGILLKDLKLGGRRKRIG